MAAPATDPRLALVEDPAQLTALLSPPRRSILRLLAKDPASATGLAAELGSTRQKVNYHLRALERAGLVELAEERRRRGFTERVLRATARAYVVSQDVMEGLGLDEDTVRDRFSSAYLIASAQRTARDVARMATRADAAGKRLPTFTLEVDVAFESADDRNAFTDELTRTIGALAERYGADAAATSRSFRFTLGAHPVPKTPEESLP